MSTKQTDFVFWNLKEAIVDSVVNIHRLSQLTGPGVGRLGEETLTDLLVGGLTGLRPYRVEAPCPLCDEHLGESARRGSRCVDWDGRPHRWNATARALSKSEEGKGQRENFEKEDPANADWVMQFLGRDEEGRDLTLRIMVQAKLGSEGDFITNFEQLEGLISRAAHYGAAPYYALYVRHGDAHANVKTSCSHRIPSAESSVLLVHANRVKQLRTTGRLPVTSLYRYARPLICMNGCPQATGGRDFSLVRAFVKRDDPSFEPSLTDELPQLTEGVRSQVTINTTRQAVPRDARLNSEADRAEADLTDAIVVVRAGGDMWSTVDGREGREPRPVGENARTPEQRQEATRMYWRMNVTRARRVRYLVRSLRGQVTDVFRVVGDEVILHDIGSGTRCEFQVERVHDGGEHDRVEGVAIRRLAEVKGSRSPFVFADDVRGE